MAPPPASHPGPFLTQGLPGDAQTAEPPATSSSLQPPHPPSCSSPTEALILALTCDSLAFGAVPPGLLLGNTISDSFGALAGDLLGQSPQRFCPTCRLPGPPHPSQEAKEQAFLIRTHGDSAQAFSSRSSLLAGQRGRASSSLIRPAQTCPPGPATPGPLKTPPRACPCPSQEPRAGGAISGPAGMEAAP